MPRRREFDKLIVRVLREAQEGRASGLRFGEIKERLSELLGREVSNQVVAENLAYLMSKGLVEKAIEERAVVYKLTQRYFDEAVREAVKGLVGSAPKVYVHLHSEERPPFAVFGDFALSDEERAHLNLLVAKDPANVIASLMYEELDRRPEAKRRVAALVAWAYWAGVRKEVEAMEVALKGRLREDLAERLLALEKTKGEYLEDCRRRLEKLRREYEETGDRAVLRLIEVLEGDLKAVEVEKELLSRQSLKEFLSLLDEWLPYFSEVSTKAYVLKGPTLADSTLRFTNYHRYVISGLITAGLVSDPLKASFSKEAPPSLRLLLNHEDVWNSLFEVLIREATGLRPNEIQIGGVGVKPRVERLFEPIEVSGDLERARRATRLYGDALEVLLELPYRVRCVIAYVWDPSIVEVAMKEVAADFDEWLQALKEGRIDEPWLASDEVIERVRKVLRAVEKGRAPPDEIIDCFAFSEVGRPWTALDVWLYHPRGKDPELWREVLEGLLKLKERARREED